MSLEAAFGFMGEFVTVPIVPPEGSHERYLSSFEIRTAGLAVVRMGLQLHTRNVADLHTVCTRSGSLTIECGTCRYTITGVEPFDVLAELVDHVGREHPWENPRMVVRELDPGTRLIERRGW